MQVHPPIECLVERARMSLAGLESFIRSSFPFRLISLYLVSTPVSVCPISFNVKWALLMLLSNNHGIVKTLRDACFIFYLLFQRVCLIFIEVPLKD